MLSTLRQQKFFNRTTIKEEWHHDGDQVLSFRRGSLLFVFNFSPSRSYTDYGFRMPEGSYRVVLNTDSPSFGGRGLADDSVEHFTTFDPDLKKEGKGWLKLYLVARSALVLKKV